MMMTLTPDNIRLVRQTWADVTLIADDAAKMFYDRLFRIDPDVKKLFATTDMSVQRHKLIATLDAAVAALDRPDAMRESLVSLGERHAGYRVEPHHYDTVGAALLWTLAEGLGPRFRPEARAAWTAAYALVAGTMRDAASRVSAPLGDGR